MDEVEPLSAGTENRLFVLHQPPNPCCSLISQTDQKPLPQGILGKDASSDPRQPSILIG
jgi:hypothetical protein